MYVVKNPGKFPVIIRDLNYHIAGGKVIDLDDIFARSNVEKSVDLKRLLHAKKIRVINKGGTSKLEEPQEEVRELPPSHPCEEKSSEGSSSLKEALLLKLGRDMSEIKEILEEGIHAPSGEMSGASMGEDMARQLAEVKAKNITNKDLDVSKNFEKIGKETTKEEALDSLLDIMDNLNTGE